MWRRIAYTLHSWIVSAPKSLTHLPSPKQNSDPSQKQAEKQAKHALVLVSPYLFINNCCLACWGKVLCWSNTWQTDTVLFLPGCKTASLGLHSFLNGNVSRLFLHVLRTPAIQHSSGPVPSDVAAPVAYCRETELAEIPLHSLCLTIPLAEESKHTVLALRSASDHFHPYGSVFILGCHPAAP